MKFLFLFLSLAIAYKLSDVDCRATCQETKRNRSDNGSCIHSPTVPLRGGLSWRHQAHSGYRSSPAPELSSSLEEMLKWWQSFVASQPTIPALRAP